MNVVHRIEWYYANSDELRHIPVWQLAPARPRPEPSVTRLTPEASGI
jgi:hypothetical protein